MRYKVGLAAILVATGAGGAAAQDGEKPRRIVRVALGPEIVPDHVGADGTRLSPYVNVDMKREGKTFEFEAPDESFGFGLLDLGAFEFGPSLNLESARRPSRFPVPIAKVPTTFEAGAFAQVYLGESFRVRGELRKGLGGHDGWISHLSADFIARRGDDYVFSIGPRVSWADEDYQQAYFGVTPAMSAASGLPAFDADSGVRGVGGTTAISYQFNPDWGIQAFGRYERLVGDAGRSPLIRTYGSRDQFSFGLGLSYTFGL
ncbi:MAG TPA: MipA/OmpV family protein [Allosphingosinicella sp.]|jgi:outer membrane scaffolding protein for murein synthesis (MipA/OmpV family)